MAIKIFPGFFRRIAGAVIFILFAAVIICAAVLPAMAGDKVVVPDGVTYKEASPDINARAEAKLRRVLAKEPHDFALLMPTDGKSVTTAGVFLTLGTLDKYKGQLQGLIPVKYNIPFGKDVKTAINSYAAHDPGQQTKLAGVLRDAIHVNPDYKVRKMTPAELAIIWYYIGWDINEPIFVVEDKVHKYVFNFDPAGESLFWIEDLSQPCFQLSQRENQPLTPCLCFTTVSQGNRYETRFKECEGSKAAAASVKSFTDPVTGETYAGDWKSYTAKPQGVQAAAPKRQGAKQVVLLSTDDTLKKNITVEVLTNVVKAIDEIVMNAVKNEKESFGLAIQVTVNPGGEPEFKMAADYKGDQNKIRPSLLAVYNALGAHDFPKTKADPIKFELVYDIGTAP